MPQGPEEQRNVQPAKGLGPDALAPPRHQEDPGNEEAQGQHLGPIAQQPVKHRPVSGHQESPHLEQGEEPQKAQNQQHRGKDAAALGQRLGGPLLGGGSGLGALGLFPGGRRLLGGGGGRLFRGGAAGLPGGGRFFRCGLGQGQGLLSLGRDITGSGRWSARPPPGNREKTSGSCSFSSAAAR